MIKALSVALCALSCSLTPDPVDDSDVPREFGAVDWQRKLEPALEQSKKADKPVMLLFQEVPG